MPTQHSHNQHSHNQHSHHHPPPPNSSANNPKNPSSTKSHDWILVPGNMHYAKNRSTFRTYRRAPGKIGKNRVLGVGSVELKVRRGPGPDEDRPNTLVLDDVLHLPNAVCNGLCVGKYQERNPGDGIEVCGGEGCRCRVRRGSEGDNENERDREGEGEALWYGEEYKGRSRVVLWGDRPGGSGVEDAPYRNPADLAGVDASAEELNTLYTRVMDRSLV
ncbi:hypothetical protein BJX76DRAFT_360422 [Aspergillus varians]